MGGQIMKTEGKATDYISLVIPVTPVGKARHRTTVRGGHAVAYPDPKASGDIEMFVTWAKEKMPRIPPSGPLNIQIHAYFPVPKSWSKIKTKAALEGRIRHTKKPDADNVLKFACDCLNGLFYLDDSQICSMSICKLYGTFPKWEIYIYYL
jgi:Holliday junction resolvase RusA-like endonuclease